MYKKEKEQTNSALPNNVGEEMIVFLEHWKRRRKRFQIYRYCLCAAIFLCSIVLGMVGYNYLYDQLPSVLRVKEGTVQELDFGLPLTGEVVAVSDTGKSNIPEGAVTIDLSDRIHLEMGTSDTYQMNVKLFGFIPFKQVDIQVIGDTELTPMGIPIGLYVETEGLLVIGVGDFEGEDGITYSPSKYILKSGDYILEYDGRKISDKDEFIRAVEACRGQDIVLKIKRDGMTQNVSIRPEKNSGGKYKIGVWVRDNAQGVGTMTYIDSEGKFGALGHGITDVDTSTLMEVEDGTLYKTEIVSIKKGQSGVPGEMTGMIIYNEDRILGDIDYNGVEGIFGTCNEKAISLCKEKALPIGLKQEIEKGTACIYCSLDGATDYYEVEITNIHLDHDNVNRGIELKVTDPKLLEVTGGIVQGMSGSPILQDGKLVGAVTHVCVNL